MIFDKFLAISCKIDLEYDIIIKNSSLVVCL